MAAAATIETQAEKIRILTERVSSVTTDATRKRDNEDIIQRTLILAPRAADEALADATKQAASDFLLKYFANSTFTTCTARWPNCPGSIEDFYDHCASGAWHNGYLTPNRGSDVNAYGTIAVIGAIIHADGSWIVRYARDGGSGALYEWSVDVRGVANGVYQYPAGSGPLQPLNGPYTWTQPVGPDPYTGQRTCA